MRRGSSLYFISVRLAKAAWKRGQFRYCYTTSYCQFPAACRCTPFLAKLFHAKTSITYTYTAFKPLLCTLLPIAALHTIAALKIKEIDKDIIT
ncbi:hypothetical protein NPIL_525751 [Nephila pilipes]|uniref:Uncharacterized protein n=1 Tax=Nephila pilipes TaxID=299642 RepID=A0A8X6PPG5_NEPPI|nr:hypothetical protein NPIL_525751 [Nephila pilipes]